MRLLLCLFLVSVPAYAQVPDHRDVPQKLFATGLYNLQTHDGQGAFVDAVVATLHARDTNWGHLRKKSGQTSVHGHGEDAALYLSGTAGQSTAVDFIGGAGGPNPQPGWGVDTPRYNSSDWADPFNHGYTSAPPPPVCAMPPYPFPETQVDGAGQALFADFAEAGQSPNPEMFRFAFRVAYDWLAKNVASLDASIAKHRREWRAILGLP